MVEPAEESGPVADIGGGRLRSYLATRPWKVAVAVVVAASTVAIVGNAILEARSEPAGVTGPAPSPVPSPSSLAGLPFPAAEDGGELRIVESGFSLIIDVAGEPLVTWGLVVENTSRVTAASVEVSLDILDQAGESLVTEISDYARSRVVNVVMPGERAGIGDATYVAGPDVADMTFRLGDPQWWPVGNPVYPAAPLTASLTEVSREEGGGVVMYWDEEGIRALEEDQGPLVMRFRVESGYDHILDRFSAQAIFRDEDGTIVGGTHPGDTDRWATVPPGWSIQWIRVRYGPPAHADLSRTEIYPYPSCC